MANKYEQDCLQLDKELAELLGWTNVADSCKYGKPPNQTEYSSCPIQRWTQNDAEAFRLMVEYNVELEMFDAFVSDFRTGPNYYYAEFPNKQSTVRFAIVQAVVNKLKGN